MKIVGVGLNKTGTTTLEEIGKAGGLRTATFRHDLLVDYIRTRSAERIVSEAGSYDLLQDLPWALAFRELDEAFPGSRFVLTTRRDDQVWLQSLSRHCLSGRAFVRNGRNVTYGYRFPQGHESAFLTTYRLHNEAVRSFFKERPQDFLDACWESGTTLGDVMAFVGQPATVGQRLPHANRAQDRSVRRRVVMRNRVLARLLSGSDRRPTRPNYLSDFC